MRDYKVLGTTIPANESLSGMVDLGKHAMIAVEMPATWAGTQISFQAKSKEQEDDNIGVGEANPEVWKNVYDDNGSEVILTVGANRIVSVDQWAGALAPLRFIRIRSGSSATPVNQNPDKTIKIIVKE